MKVGQKRRRVLGLAKQIYIGWSSDGAEIIATYCTRREAETFRFPDEIVTGPWMRVPRAKRKKGARTT